MPSQFRGEKIGSRQDSDLILEPQCLAEEELGCPGEARPSPSPPAWSGALGALTRSHRGFRIGVDDVRLERRMIILFRRLFFSAPTGFEFRSEKGVDASALAIILILMIKSLSK